MVGWRQPPTYSMLVRRRAFGPPTGQAVRYSRVLTTMTLAFIGACSVPGGVGEERLLRALEKVPRPVEGRLSMSPRFAPFDDTGPRVPVRGGHAPVGRVVRGARWTRDAVRDHDAMHHRGLLALARGQVGEAVHLISAATERPADGPDVEASAAAHSDLAAAFLAYAAESRPWHHADALASALVASTAESTDPVATFNLALVLERSFLWHQADHAWARYLALDDDPGWHAEAQRHRQDLDERSADGSASAVGGQVVEAIGRGDEAAIQRIADDFPTELRAWFLDQGLDGWLEAESADSLRRVGNAIDRRSGARFYLDVAQALDQRPGAAIAEAIQLFRTGMRATRSVCEEAEPGLSRAASVLRAAGNPLAFVAQLEGVVCRYRRDPEAAEPAFADLAAQLEATSYWTLRARVAYMRGLCRIAAGYPSEALAFYREAESLIAPVGGSDALVITGLFGEAYRLIGDDDEAWRYRMRTLGAATERGDQRLRHVVLSNLANELTDRGRSAVARVVLNEMLANARAWDEAGAVVETLLRRVALATKEANAVSARVDVEACRIVLARVTEAGHRERFTFELALVEAESLLAAAPSRALAVLEPAVEDLEAQGHQLLLPRALVARARAELASGDAETAEATFERALAVFRKRYDATQGEEHRIRFFEQAQPAFDAMIHLHAVQRGDANRALRTLARAQARGLVDRLAEIEQVAPETGGDGPVNPVRVVYATLPDHLVIWISEADGWRMAIEHYGRADVTATVAALRRAIVSGSDDQVLTAASDAYDVFLRPVTDLLPAGRPVIFVPDRELHRLPFAALYDHTRGRYLVEDHPVIVAPSLVHATRSGFAPQVPTSVLTVGDPAFDPERFALPRLPAAAGEAQKIAGLYPRGQALLDHAATRTAVLGALSGHQAVHLAAHVQIDPRRPLRSRLITAGDEASLRVADLDPLRLAGVGLVFLSACDTAPGYLDGNREGVGGFARALLAAGVPSVIATLWAADDLAAARLSVAFHQHYRSHGDRARALQQAQLSLLADSAFSAPFNWANFQLYGG